MICKNCGQTKRGRPHPSGLCKECRRNDQDNKEIDKALNEQAESKTETTEE